MGNRMTAHSRRMAHSKAKHLDRDKVSAEHIDSKKAGQNRYWNMYDGDYSGRTKKEHMTMEAVEKRCYEEHFSEHIDQVNKRADSGRHYDRRTSVSKMLTNQRTRPQDDIFQIGSVRDDVINPTDLWHIWLDFLRWHQETYPQIVIMDCAMHMDESVPHIHSRQCYYYISPDGVIHEGQEKALEQMGIELPEPDKPRSRYNNRKMTYTRQTREKLIDICAEFGYDIITEPIENAKHDMKKEEYLIEVLKGTQEGLLKEKADLERSLFQLKDKKKELKKRNDELKKENVELKKQIKYMDIFESFVEEAEAERSKNKIKGKGKG